MEQIKDAITDCESILFLMDNNGGLKNILLLKHTRSMSNANRSESIKLWLYNKCWGFCTKEGKKKCTQAPLSIILELPRNKERIG
ncbi:hypothetical protein P4619_02500, partial [Halalkalibacterium halodurans]|nr:hypothetical protein [Halalkalibacterium halodurans]